MAEFGAALVLLFFFAVGFIDIIVIPIRWYIVREIVIDYAQRLSICNSFSEALSLIDAEPSLERQLNKIIGIKSRSIRCSLYIYSPRSAASYVVEKPGAIPNGWLPDGKNAPLIYDLQLAASVDIAPLFTLNLGALQIPGLSTTVCIPISSEASWEHLGRDPYTKRYFMSE